MEKDFIPHLQCHSEFSLTHGIIRLNKKHERSLGALAAARNIPAVALTDTNNVYGAIQHYESCVDNGVKPILGCQAAFGAAGAEFHATLLCEDKDGFVSLSKLLTAAQKDGGGRIDPAALRPEDCRGLIMLSGYGGDAALALRQRRAAEAQRLIERWLALFGREHLALQLSFGGRKAEDATSLRLAELAAANELPIVAAHPILYPDPEDFEAHDVRACIANTWAVDDESRPRPHSKRQHMPDAAEMRQLFKDFPEALANAREIALRCNYDFGVNAAPLFPKIPGTAAGEAAAALRDAAAKGLDALPALAAKKERYAERLERELGVIIAKGFADYFLIVADLARFAKAEGIPIGPGRGSGAGSLVAYALGITATDPIRYGLLFERFLNPERTSLPDFDIDFCKDRRDEVIEHARATYGEDCVAQVITFGSLKARAVVRDVARVLGLGYGQGDALARLIPEAIGITLEQARADSKDLDRLLAGGGHEQLWRYCLALEGLPRQASTHAAAILIAPRPLVEFCPVTAVGDSKKVRLVSQYDKDCAEKIGLIKFDILGLKNLTMIDGAVRLIRERTDPDFAIEKIDLEDPKAYEVYRRGDKVGIFQCESRGMVELIRRIVPRTVEDIAIAISLYRPGALNNDMDEKFLANRGSAEEIVYEHPKMEAILAETSGAMVYQEQVMLLTRALAGFSLAEADTLRAAMGKKDAAVMATLRKKFIAGGAKQLGEDRAIKMFEEIKEFAGYGFNKSHAIAYALLSVQTAFLKANHPVEFFTAALSAFDGDVRGQEALLRDIKSKEHPEVGILPPCVNESAAAFSIAKSPKRGPGLIRYGLASIRAVGSAAAAAIVEARAAGPYRDLDDLCQRVPAALLNRRALESLVDAGACDALLPQVEDIGKRRAALAASVAAAVEEAEHRLRNANQDSLFGGGDAAAAPPRRPPDVKAWSPQKLLAGEHQALGTTLSGEFSDVLQRLRAAGGGRNWRAVKTVADMPNGAAGTWIGHVARRVTSARLRSQGKEVFILDDGDATAEVRVARELVRSIKLEAPGNIVVVRGEVDSDERRIYQPGIQASGVQLLDDWLRSVRRVTVDCAKEEDLDWCLENLQANSGKGCALRFVLHRDGAAVAVDTGAAVPIDVELFERAYSKLGAAALRLG
ncbi:MAG: DNA polymerase III subunit alpha [Betaproteobacteria bacterium AqS2]|uniref:DNA-directed DNA polymerase n=1 Tax=Candidatus Amphirhobacter heronislandensis TaxID=1732024 RepID=A0A930UDL3_9GAMM|nr:DNA polymerase III subunit alpha [Betaproteobacteria bacterium AqS2]